MKIVLINPIVNEKQLSYVHKRLLPPVPPMSLCYIAAILENNGFRVHVIDQYAYRLNNEQLLQKIKDIRPDTVGFSCLTPTINNIRELSKKIRLFNKDIKIVLGNLHATLFADEILKEKIADVVVRGEGEYTALELFSVIRSGRSFSRIKGISYRTGADIVHNQDRPAIKNLEDIPYPAWHLLNWKCYSKAPMLGLKGPAVLIQASRGCLFQCSFCAQDKIHKGFRTRDVNSVIDEIEYVHKRLGIRNFVFGDSFFPHSLEQGYEFSEKLRVRNLHKKIKWVIETRIDQINAALLEKMKEAGLYLIMFGFESGSQRILDSMGKNVNIEVAKQTMAIVKKSEILTLGLFMIGMPEETVETCKETINFAKQLDCDMIKFNIVIPYPGTQLYERCRESINPKCSYEDFTSWGTWLSNSRELPFVPQRMTSLELIKMQRRAMFSYYMRFGFILKHFLKLRILNIGDIVFGGLFLLWKFLK